VSERAPLDGSVIKPVISPASLIPKAVVLVARGSRWG
jgi:hypothetical protein